MALPASLDIPGEFILSVTEYGEHRIEFEASDREENETVVGQVSLWVVDPSAFADQGN